MGHNLCTHGLMDVSQEEMVKQTALGGKTPPKKQHSAICVYQHSYWQ